MSDQRQSPPGSQTIFDDTMLVAFLKLRDNHVIPQYNAEDKNHIEFRIDGDPQKIQEDLHAFYSNAPVGVRDYVGSLKTVKSLMYGMKKIMEE